jgi:hypothetical protein
MARTKMPRTVWRGEGSKAFFSEEKKQKTFDFSGVCAAWTVRDSIKLKNFAATVSERHLGLV